MVDKLARPNRRIVNRANIRLSTRTRWPEKVKVPHAVLSLEDAATNQFCDRIQLNCNRIAPIGSSRCISLRQWC